MLLRPKIILNYSCFNNKKNNNNRLYFNSENMLVVK
jgi:hypothetical protein